jgi:type VI secretion system protein ImpG
MRDDLLVYYERELTWLRRMGAQFSEKYPKVASRLLLETDKCEDPHVERILEGFAFLAARVHLKIDDEFPEISEALLGLVYPQLVRPLPSMAIVEFQLDPRQGKLMTGLQVNRDTLLYSKPVNGVPCKFRTCYDTVVWPLSVTAAEWKSPDRLKPALPAVNCRGALRLELQCANDVRFSHLAVDHLRFYLNGESAVVNTIYELLDSKLARIVIRDPSPKSKVAAVTLPSNSLRTVGFEEREGVLPYSQRSFLGYRLLQEYFSFPEKFLFIDLRHLQNVWAAGFTDRVELIFLISNFEPDYQQRLELGISPRTFRLGCSPVINLFPHTAEPILLNQRKYEYQVVPDVRRPAAMEVFSVEEVASLNPQTKETTRYEPFYSFRHSSMEHKQDAFWLANRRPATRLDDDGTEIFLSLIDLSMRPRYPESDTLTVRTICTNRDLPSRLPFGNESGDFEMESNTPIKRIVTLQKPTDPIRPAMGKAALWRLISQLSLNYLSLVEEGKEALQQILKLYNFTESTFSRKMIEGILHVSSEKEFARVVSDQGISFARGTHVRLKLDEEQFTGNGAYLFAAVIERFLAQYSSLNSFSQLTVSSAQRKEDLREWPPRAGRKILM